MRFGRPSWPLRCHCARWRAARDAIYIDFEGFQDQPPALLGILVGGEFEQVVFDRSLAEAARSSWWMSPGTTEMRG